MKRSFFCIRNTEGHIVDSMRLFVSTFVGVVFGLLLRISFPSISLTKMNLTPVVLTSIHLSCINDEYSGLSAHALFDAWSGHSSYEQDTHDVSRIWVSTNPRGAERLPPGIVQAESDLYPRRLWGLPCKDLQLRPKYLVTFTVGVNQKPNIDAAVKKFSEDFTIVLFHYDGQTSEWEEFEWAKRAIHVSVPKQTKWWYAKRFLHPDIVASYEYIFIWDEDLGLEHFNGEEYVKLVRKHNLHISQPGVDPSSGYTWVMTKKRDDGEFHKVVEERAGVCKEPHSPPCAAFVEIMAPVFSRDAWRCVWHMIQNDLVHGWGLDFAFERCVEAPAHEKVGVVDSQWIVHQHLPSLGNQGKNQNGKAGWEGVRERCLNEWGLFNNLLSDAEAAYYLSLRINSTSS